MPVWDVVKFSYESFLLVLHGTTLACIFHERRRNNSQFSSPFYAFYVLQSVFDIWFVLAYGICAGLANFGIYVPLVNVGLGLGTYGQLGQGISHALISYNRYTTIVHPHQNQVMWTKRRITALCLLALLLPIPVVVNKLQVQYRLVYVESMGAYTLAYSAGLSSTLNGFLVFGYTAVCVLVSMGFEATTFHAFYRLSRTAQFKCRDDYKLLLYALTQCVGQILAAFCASSVVIRAFFSAPYFLSIVPFLFHVTVDILGLSGPVCLLFTSQAVRASYVRVFCGRSKRNKVASELRTVTTVSRNMTLPAVSG